VSIFSSQAFGFFFFFFRGPPEVKHVRRGQASLWALIHQYHVAFVLWECRLEVDLCDAELKNGSRVTRLGYFLPILLCLVWAVFERVTEVVQFFVLPFQTAIVIYVHFIFDKKSNVPLMRSSKNKHTCVTYVCNFAIIAFNAQRKRLQSKMTRVSSWIHTRQKN
jgi:hypothetical protein